MTAYNQHNEPEDIQVSQKMIKDLNALYTPAQQTPMQVDRNVLDRAQRHLTRSKRRFWRHAVRWSSVAAAAVIVFLFVLVDPLGDDFSGPTQDQSEVGEALAKKNQEDMYEEKKPINLQKTDKEESPLTVAMNADADLPNRLNMDSIAPLGAPSRYTARDETSSVMAKEALQKQDLDRSGRVDILDAFFLARQIEKQLELQSQWDVTGDGTINQKDVDAIASTAVRVRKDVL
jgi:hypothetical protein